jgi:hypothetical protein
MSIYLQYSKGKEFALPVFQTHTLSSFPPSCDSYKIPLEFPQSKRGLTRAESIRGLIHCTMADRGRVLLLGPFAPIAIPYLEQQQQPKKTIIYPK